jgi:hypothetical protein
VLKSQSVTTPNCFGDLFEDTATECVGGFDAKWTDGPGGSRIRPMCDFVDACSKRVHERKAGPQIIPTSSLLRPQPHTSFGTSPPTSGYQSYTRPAAPQRAWSPPSQQQAPPPQYAPNQYQHQSHFAGHYGIPQYLSVRQPVNSGPIVERMWWEVLRSVGKAIGHTLANFFDSEIFGRHGGPGPGSSNGT